MLPGTPILEVEVGGIGLDETREMSNGAAVAVDGLLVFSRRRWMSPARLEAPGKAMFQMPLVGSRVRSCSKM